MAVATKNLKAKIRFINKDPKHPGRHIITVEFDDGDTRGPWKQDFSVKFDRPLSLEEFAKYLAETDIAVERPDESLKYLQESKDKEFVLNPLKEPQSDPA